MSLLNASHMKIGLPYLCETWQDTAGIDPVVWVTPVTGTGDVLRSTAEAAYQKAWLTGPAAADTARLASVQQWQAAPGLWGTTTIGQRLDMDFEGRLVLPTSVENAAFLMGLGSAALATRATADIAGFILLADVLQALTDDGGVETLTALAGIDLTLWHHFGLVIRPGAVEFFVDKVQVARHDANLPDAAMYAQFYLPQEAGVGGAELHVGPVSLRPDCAWSTPL